MNTKIVTTLKILLQLCYCIGLNGHDGAEEKCNKNNKHFKSELA